MVKLRLKRFGRRNRPFYRITAVDQRAKRDGKSIEELGWFNPIEKDPEKRAHINVERVQYWISVGAQPSATVYSLISKAGVEVKNPPVRKQGQTTKAK